MAHEIIDALPIGITLRGKSYLYKILKVLGQGSFGITYLASVKMDSELGEITTYVAIKEFFMHDINGREQSTVTCSSKTGLFTKYRHSFVNEAKRLASMRHPGIVKVLESFEANNTVYYSMQHISGGTLGELIDKKGYLTEIETLQYADMIAEALEYMHCSNVLHLDLKPGNIMLQQGRAILIDFGLSKQFDENGMPETSTSIGGGTPGYSPLEQTNNFIEKTELPITMDIYSLGATMFKMLTGYRPPLASDILNSGFPAHELEKRDISAKTIALIETMMAPMKRNRPKDITTVRSYLHKLLDDISIVHTVVELPKFDERTIVNQKYFQSEPTPQIAKPIPKIETKSPDNHQPITHEPKVEFSDKYDRKKPWGKIIGFSLLAVGIFIVVMIGIKIATDIASSSNPNYDPIVKTLSVGDIDIDMIEIEGGSFDMGSEDGDDDEKPVHRVSVGSFMIAQKEVTQDLWLKVMGSLPEGNDINDGADMPVQNVSWDDCQQFIEKLNDLTGEHFRLPSESEWEFAAKGGNIGLENDYKFSGARRYKDVAWTIDNSGFERHEVGQMQPNQLGIYDMSGNVFEWCNNHFESYDQTQKRIDERVLRGGSWYYGADRARVSNRKSAPQDMREYSFGIRLAL